MLVDGSQDIWESYGIVLTGAHVEPRLFSSHSMPKLSIWELGM